MKRRSSGNDINPDAWLTTYGDMITLVLCFFVLMYSMMSIDVAKWEMLVGIFNPNANTPLQAGHEGDLEQQGIDPDMLVDSFEEIAETINQALQNAGLAGSVGLFTADGITFIQFKDSVFFDPNSAILRPSAAEPLTIVINSLKGIESEIGQIKVYGHTAQVQASQENPNIDFDRKLSSERADNVVLYLQRNGTVHGSRLEAQGMASYHPMYPNDNEANRQMNRRVEILIAKSGTATKTLQEIYEIIQEHAPADIVENSGDGLETPGNDQID
ncbi:MAG: flagellar motor protein MotB [Oscillospiraceae bacterium]|nr:flagellar motor protein MotB [Oscillospiraceae bacterium]